MVQENHPIENLLDKFEKEFLAKPESARAFIFELVATIDVHCRNCFEQQRNKKIVTGPFGFIQYIKPKPYDLNISGSVTQMVGRMLSAYLPKSTREIMELYSDSHIAYKCEEARLLIRRAYGRLSKHMTED